jgi:superfamily II DNA helicase RecQ
LAAQVVRASERKTALFSAIQAYGAPGVVLAATTQEVDAAFAELSSRGLACVRAHAGMPPDERSAALARFVDPRERLVLVTQSPHANASGLAGCPETALGLGSAAPRADLRFVIHYQAPLSLEQHFEDLAWLSAGAHSLVLADSSDAALVQAILAQQRIKPAAIEAMAQALAHAPEGATAQSDTLALRAGTSRRSAERVLFAFADRNLIARDSGQISRLAAPEALAAEGRLLSMRFASLRAADAGRAESIAQYVTSRHGSAPAAPAASGTPALGVRL